MNDTRTLEESSRPKRREPADSPRHPDLEDDAEPTGGSSPGTHPQVHRGSSPRGGELRDDEQDPIERGMETERRPDRPSSDEDPTEGKCDRQPPEESDEGPLERLCGRIARDRDDVREREDERTEDDAWDGAPAADPGRRREAAEQDLLAQRRDDHPGQQ